MDTFLILVMFASFLVLGAAWRVWDGIGWPLPGGARVAVGASLAVSAAFVGGAEWWSLWLGGAAALTMAAGYTKWENPFWMMARYGVPAAVIVIPYATFGGGDPLACAIYAFMGPLVGLSWTVLTRIGQGKIAEAITGAALIGGLVML